MSENLEQLHNQIVFQAKEHRKAEARLIDLLQRADQTRLYLHRGHASLFRYVCDELGYSESVTIIRGVLYFSLTLTCFKYSIPLIPLSL